VFVGSGDHHVYALDAATGALAWKFETGDVVHTSPAVVDGVVYLGRWDRNMFAPHPSPGAVVLEFPTRAPPGLYPQVGRHNNRH